MSNFTTGASVLLWPALIVRSIEEERIDRSVGILYRYFPLRITAALCIGIVPAPTSALTKTAMPTDRIGTISSMVLPLIVSGLTMIAKGMVTAAYAAVIEMFVEDLPDSRVSGVSKLLALTHGRSPSGRLGELVSLKHDCHVRLLKAS
jgi:hypothetical protein